MRTPKSSAASRANGSKSRGPVTEAGKRRPSINARRHGLLSKGVVLNNEVAETFQLLLQQHIDKFAPADDIEQNAIEEMTAGIWRLRRLWMIEKHVLDRTVKTARNVRTINAPVDLDEGDRIAAAFSELARGPELSLLGRYESRLHRMCQRALNNFLLLREFEPSPTQEVDRAAAEPPAPPAPDPSPDSTPRKPDPIHDPDPIPHEPLEHTPSSARGALAAFPAFPEISKQTRESLTNSPSSPYPVNSTAQFAQRCTTKTGSCPSPHTGLPRSAYMKCYNQQADNRKLAVVAILQREAGHRVFADIVEAAEPRSVSVAGFVEPLIVIETPYGAKGLRATRFAQLLSADSRAVAGRVSGVAAAGLADAVVSPHH